jgi:ligand-binding sensor domain-containing protein/serine phosphatase RsbU (regulator of sigma subunit)
LVWGGAVTALGQQFTHLSTAGGLSDVSAYAFAKDLQGYVWIGTQEGLNRYDGSRVASYFYHPQDSSTLSENHIRALHLDRQGHLWVGTNSAGICRYLPKGDAFERYLPDTLPGALGNGEIWGFAEDGQGGLWVATRSGLYRKMPDSPYFKVFLPGADVTAVAYEPLRQQLWAAVYGKGIVRISFSRSDSLWVEEMPVPASVKGGLAHVTALAAIDGSVWAGTRYAGAFRWHPSTDEWTPLSAGPGRLPNARIRALAPDEGGRLWVGTEDGLALVQGGRAPKVLRVFKHAPRNTASLSDHAIRALFNDQEGHLWIGTRIGGADRLYLRSKPFYSVSRAQGLLPHNTVRALLAAGDQTLWVGTDGGGLAKYGMDGRPAVSMVRSGMLPDEQICALFQDSKGRIWAGTRQGLAYWQPGMPRFKTFRYKPGDSNSLPDSEVFAVAEDGQARIWAASAKGLAIYMEDTKLFRRIVPQPGVEGALPAGDINSLLYSYTGDLWVGTFGEGLVRCRPDLMHFEKFPKNLPPNSRLAKASINCLYQTYGGDELWVGTYKDGVFRVNIKTGNFQHYTIANGLNSNIVFGIQEDGQGNLWLSTPRGLMKYVPSHDYWRSYDAQDGLPSTEFNYSAVAQMPNGRVVFGGLEGLVHFSPDSIVDSDQPPRVVLTKLRVLNREVKPGADAPLAEAVGVAKVVKLSHEQAFFSIEYTSLSYTYKDGDRYAYRLEGLEEQWNEVGNRQEAFYTNVPHGNYTFHVKAANNDGVWNEEGASIQIVIEPPIWRTLWFQISVALAVLGTIVGVYKARVRQIERNSLVLEAQVRARTAQVVKQKEELAQQAATLQQANDYIQGQHKALQAKQEETEQAYRRIQAMTEIGQELAAHLDEAALVKSLYAKIAGIMPVDALGVGTWNPQQSRLEYRGFMERDEELPFHYEEVSDNSRLAVRAFRDQRMLLLNNLLEEGPELLGIPLQAELGEVPQSAIYLPLMVEGQAVGVLTAQSFQQNAYAQNEVDVLLALSSYVAIAVENARAFFTIKEKNQQITDSIRYARTIQQAILPPDELMGHVFGEHLVYYRPKDIVSGDFYWMQPDRVGGGWFLVVADCTGHGVPGAFMSMIGSRLLKEAVQEQGLRQPADILEYVDRAIRKALQQDVEEGNGDGMDMAICRLGPRGEDTEVVFAGAKLSMFRHRPGSGTEVVPHTRRSIGGLQPKVTKPFEEHAFLLLPGETLYFSTDGLLDQNSNALRRLGKQGFMRLLDQHAGLPMHQQLQHLSQLAERMTQEAQQRDDITVFALKGPVAPPRKADALAPAQALRTAGA